MLRRRALGGALSRRRSAEALEDLASLMFVRYPRTSPVERIWALRHDLTVYDVAYVALAGALDAPLVTMDARLAQAPGHNATALACLFLHRAIAALGPSP